MSSVRSSLHVEKSGGPEHLSGEFSIIKARSTLGHLKMVGSRDLEILASSL
jgi:hypothetical protein